MLLSPHSWRRALLGAFVLGVVSFARAQPAPLPATANEDGSLRIALSLRDGALSYEVVHRDAKGGEVCVVETSPLGLQRDDADFRGGLQFTGSTPATWIDQRYTLAAGKRREIQDRAREQSFDFADAVGRPLRVTVRVMSDAVAFRYEFPDPKRAVKILGESTGFKLPARGEVWLQPYDRIADWAPSYEAEYNNGIAVGTAAPADAAGWAFPALFHVSDRWVLLTEANVRVDNYGAHLEAKCDGGLYRVRLPEDEEALGVAPKEPTVSGAWTSAWRLIVVGSDVATIAQTDAVTDLSEASLIPDAAWVKPGRASWSWWSDKGSPQDYHRLVPFIDLSAEYGWEYALVDAGWEHMRNGTVEQLVAYAKSKNVGLLLWYNSGGKHNRVICGLRDRIDDPAVREREFAWLERLGVKGVKVDFMQSDKPYVMQLYLDILRDAARHHLVVGFHGATIPRGWARTYPNLLTSEGVRGAEQYWDPNFAEKAQMFHTIYPFTRNVLGSMDYTPVVFGAAPELQWHKTTNAHELATAVVFESGVQHFTDSQASYRAQPDAVQQYLKDVPVAWDETRLLAGKPGDFCVFARRRGDTWWIAGLNGTTQPRTLTVKLDFLGAGAFALEAIADGASQKEYTMTHHPVTSADVIDYAVAVRGGFTVKVRPRSP